VVKWNIKKQLNKRGVKESMYEAYTAGEKDYSALVSKMKAAGLVVDFGRPSYSPSKDTVHMPAMESFKSYSHYVATMAHEIGHWTAKRVERDQKGWFGSDPYAKEEAVAEWFSMLVCNEFGVDREESEMDNRAAYIQHWTARFKEDPKMLAEAFKEAEKAFRWVMKETGIEAQSWNEEAEEVAA